MPIISADEAKNSLYKLLDEISEAYEPVVISGKRGNAVLILEDHWRAMRETLTLLSVPGMRESIRAGISTNIDDTTDSLDW